MKDLIKELEGRISAKRKELEDEERALATVKRMMAQTSDVQQQKIESIHGLGVFKFEDLIDSVEKIKKRTLADEIRDVVSKFDDNEFTVAHIEAALKKMGIVVDAKSPRARIGISLTKLVEEGFVDKVFEGAGNVPHRYKLKHVDNDLA